MGFRLCAFGGDHKEGLNMGLTGTLMLKFKGLKEGPVEGLFRGCSGATSVYRDYIYIYI